jgi:hypothetical protein
MAVLLCTHALLNMFHYRLTTYQNRYLCKLQNMAPRVSGAACGVCKEQCAIVYCRTCDMANRVCDFCYICDAHEHTGQVCTPCPHERTLVHLGEPLGPKQHVVVETTTDHETGVETKKYVCPSSCQLVIFCYTVSLLTCSSVLSSAICHTVTHTCSTSLVIIDLRGWVYILPLRWC